MVVNLLIGFPRRQNREESENNLPVQLCGARLNTDASSCVGTLPRGVLGSDHFMLTPKMLRRQEAAQKEGCAPLGRH